MGLFGPPDVERLKAKGKIKGLAKALRYKDPDIRMEAAVALLEVGDASAVPLLFEATVKTEDRPFEMSLSDRMEAEKRDKKLREVATKALVHIGEPGVLHLVKKLSGGSKEVRAAAAEVLGDMGDRRAVGPLIPLLVVEDENPCDHAMSALVKIGEPAVEPLLDAFKDPYSHENVRDYAIRILGRIGDPRAVDTLMAEVVSDKNGKRVLAALCVGEIGESALQALYAGLAHDDSDVRSASARGLEQIGDTALTKLLSDVKGTDPQARDRAIEALGWFGEGAATTMVGLARGGDPQLQEVGLRVLREIGRPTNEVPGNGGDMAIAAVFTVERILNLMRKATPDQARQVEEISALVKPWSSLMTWDGEVTDEVKEAFVDIHQRLFLIDIEQVYDGDGSPKDAVGRVKEVKTWAPSEDMKMLGRKCRERMERILKRHEDRPGIGGALLEILDAARSHFGEPEEEKNRFGRSDAMERALETPGGDALDKISRALEMLDDAGGDVSDEDREEVRAALDELESMPDKMKEQQERSAPVRELMSASVQAAMEGDYETAEKLSAMAETQAQATFGEAAETSKPSLELIERYFTMDHPHSEMESMMGLPSSKPEYRVLDGGQIGRISDPVQDMKIVSTAAVLTGGRVNLDDTEAISRKAMEVITHFAKTAKVHQFFMLPYHVAQGIVVEGTPIPPEQICRVYTGTENLLLEVYEELPEGGKITEESVAAKIDAITEEAKKTRES